MQLARGQPQTGEANLSRVPSWGMPQPSNLDPLPSRAICCVPLVRAPLSAQRAEVHPDDNLAEVVALTSLRTLA